MRSYIPTYMLVVLWIGLFLGQAAGWLDKRAGDNRRWMRVGIVSGLMAVLIGYTIFRAVSIYPQVDKSRDYRLENLWLDALTLPLEGNSVVLANWNKHGANRPVFDL